ncbi:MAG: hypothetical protein GXO25_02695 [Euryarchaeota archaeon]|nr:hypothetical protein [Euryarchaeota archaeon]
MIELVPGSKCVVYSVSSNDEIMKTYGIFKGFVPVGEDSSLCIELDSNHGDMQGKYRLIPTNMISAIDIIELAEPKQEEKKYVDTHYYS